MTTSQLNEAHAAISIRPVLGQVSREDYLDYMTFQRLIPPLFTEIFGPLPGVKEAWKEQGATPGELDFSAFRYRHPLRGHVPVSLGWIGDVEEEIVEETTEHIIARDRMGRLVKLCKGVATLALPLEYPVKDADDWQAMKHHYEFSEARFGRDWAQRSRQQLAEGRVIWVTMPGGFSEPRNMLGDERLCIAYYEQPDLIRDMLQTMGDTACEVLDRVLSEVTVDALFVHEDLAGKSGPLVGPRQVEEFIGPYYRRVWDIARERGVRLFVQDSDGNVNAVIPAFLDAGLNFMYPMEPAAGMDIVQVREQYGTRLAVEGGIDKHVLRRTKAEIVAELEYKMPPMVRTGGCVLALDHRIPNGTPLENYRFYVQKAWEIMDAETAARGLV